MNGNVVCQALRTDPKTADFTIVMLTANADAIHKVQALSGGADYIVKPFSPRDLATPARSAIRRRVETESAGNASSPTDQV